MLSSFVKGVQKWTRAVTGQACKAAHARALQAASAELPAMRVASMSKEARMAMERQVLEDICRTAREHRNRAVRRIDSQRLGPEPHTLGEAYMTSRKALAAPRRGKHAFLAEASLSARPCDLVHATLMRVC